MISKFQYVEVCEVCGKPGAATARTAAAAWFVGTFIRHDDPRVCVENIKAKLKPSTPTTEPK